MGFVGRDALPRVRGIGVGAYFFGDHTTLRSGTRRSASLPIVGLGINRQIEKLTD